MFAAEESSGEGRRIELIRRLETIENECTPWREDLEEAERAVAVFEAALRGHEDEIAERRKKMEFLEDVYARFECVIGHFEGQRRDRRAREPREALQQVRELYERLDEHDRALREVAGTGANTTWRDLCDLLADLRTWLDGTE
jgi:DNA repair exonuclease SbcCD ATPase subunit